MIISELSECTEGVCEGGHYSFDCCTDSHPTHQLTAVYYHFFALCYGLVGRAADVVMVNFPHAVTHDWRDLAPGHHPLCVPFTLLVST